MLGNAETSDPTFHEGGGAAAGGGQSEWNGLRPTSRAVYYCEKMGEAGGGLWQRAHQVDMQVAETLERIGDGLWRR